MVLVLTARSLGFLEPLELISLDILLKLRPPESPDERITLIKITQADIERWGGYPIPNHRIVELIEKLQVHKPAVIGLNLLDDLLPEKKQELAALFQKYDNLIISEKILPPQILAPQSINSNQVGFSDINIDRDQYLRRILLGTANPVNSDDLDDFKFSFTIRLADKFLLSHGYVLENGLQNPDAMRYADTEFPLIEKNYGSYIDIDAGGIQTFINYRQNKKPFNEICIQGLSENNSISHFITDHILIIGVTDPTTRGLIEIPLTRYSSTPAITGVDVQGHAVSQIISAVMDNRVLLRSWHYLYDYFWIFAWGGILSFGSDIKNKEKRSHYFLLTINLLIFTLCYTLILEGVWVSYSTILTFSILIFLVDLVRNYLVETEKIEAKKEEDRRIKEESKLRNKIIERMFLIMHNGPLQTLSSMIKDARTKNNLNLLHKLELLDSELRRIGEISKDNNSDFYHKFYLGNNKKIDLRLPISELFYQLFFETIERDLSGFKRLKVKIRSFDPITSDNYSLTIDEKRELCRFLEEMLCNIEKHAVGASQIKVIGKICKQKKIYTLRIEDNGSILMTDNQGEGTRHALNLQGLLNGTFVRFRSHSGKTCCELKWLLRR
ncbi:MAG: CHASE2 domain-containing protein [Cyanobacteria bacterium P01_F01_bin.150]